MVILVRESPPLVHTLELLVSTPAAPSAVPTGASPSPVPTTPVIDLKYNYDESQIHLEEV